MNINFFGFCIVLGNVSFLNVCLVSQNDSVERRKGERIRKLLEHIIVTILLVV